MVRRPNSEVGDREYGGREWEMLLLLLEGIKADVGDLGRDLTETDRHARSSVSRLDSVEGKIDNMKKVIEKLEEQADDSTLSLAEIKAVAKHTSMVTAAVISLVVTVLGAGLLKLFHLS